MTAQDEKPPILLLTAAQAAKALAISTRLLWTLTNCGEIPSVRLGRCVRYDLATLRVWLGKKQQKRRA